MKSKKAGKKSTAKNAQCGPAPETLKIEGKWQDAVKKSFKKKKPAQGWPS
jgi:hypothetical protein